MGTVESKTSQSSTKLADLRKFLLGPKIFDICENDPLGIKEEDLKTRLDYLKSKGFVADCTLVELVKVCQLKRYYPKCTSKEQEQIAQISTTNGLHIGTKIFKKLSGPVSMYVLSPKRIILDTERLKLPIIVLFGDKHSDMTKEKVCKNCGLPSCAYIHETSFIEELDKISSPQFPVEFSIESFNTELFNVEIDIVDQDHPSLRYNTGLIDAMQWKYYPCFLHANPEMHSKCKIGKNIRWQYADIRNFRLLFLNKDFKYWYEACLYTILTIVGDPRTTLQTLQKIGQEIKKRCKSSEIIMKQFLDHCKRMIFDFIFEFPTFCENLVSFEDDFAYISMLRKQIKKNGKIRQHSFVIENLSKWVYQYGKYQEQKLVKDFYFLYDLYPDWNQKVKTKLDECFNIIQFFAYGYPFNEKMEEKFRVMKDIDYELFYIEGFLISKLTIFLDLYYILRLFKVQDDIVPPMLSFSIFGASHSEYLVYFLTNIIGTYDIIFEKRDSDNNDNKCVNIDKPVDLNYYINEWKVRNLLN